MKENKKDQSPNSNRKEIMVIKILPKMPEIE